MKAPMNRRWFVGAISLVAATVSLLLAGCATPVVDDSKMTPEQLVARSKDKSIEAECLLINGIAGWGGGRRTTAKQDKSVAAGETSVVTNGNCDLIITTSPKPAKPASAP